MHGTAGRVSVKARGQCSWSRVSTTSAMPATMAPTGHGTHHYHFRLAALDTPRLVLSPATEVADVWPAAEPHILAETELVGTYAR